MADNNNFENEFSAARSGAENNGESVLSEQTGDRPKTRKEIKREKKENKKRAKRQKKDDKRNAKQQKKDNRRNAKQQRKDDKRNAKLQRKVDKKNRRLARREARRQNKRGRKFLIIISVAAAVLIVLALIITRQNMQLEKSFYKVQSDKVSDNVRVVCLSDLHLREFGKDNERLVHAVENLGPDIIAIVGDMNMEQRPDDYSSVLSLCKQLDEIAPLYYSLGNHEIDAMLFSKSRIYKDIKLAGIDILNNETETITVKNTAIDVIGLTQNPSEYEAYGRVFFDKAMKATDNFKLVLNHYPENFMGVLEDYEIDLALAGHAHGGQVRLPFIGGLYAADQGILPKLCDGYHEIGNSKLVISRGLGWSGLVPRINNKPEITVVDIGWY